MNLFLSKEQVDEMTYEECQGHLDILQKNYKFEKTIKIDEDWKDIDALTDTILYLEDRISEYNSPKFGSPTIEPECDSVQTPLGIFGSAKLAAEAHGWHVTNIYYHIKKSPNEYKRLI